MRFADLPQDEECIYYADHEVADPAKVVDSGGSGGLGAPSLPSFDSKIGSAGLLTGAIAVPASLPVASVLAPPRVVKLVHEGRAVYEEHRRSCAKTKKEWAAEPLLGPSTSGPMLTEGDYRELAPNETITVGWLNSCAAVFYLFIRGPGAVDVVAVHAMTGVFKGTHEGKKDTPLPSQVNPRGVTTANIQVVFATPSATNEVKSWGVGIAQLLADGIPAANIKVIYGVNQNYCAAGNGTFGETITPVWRHGNLRQRFQASVDAAWAAYQTQFPGNTTTLRFPHHSKEDGRTRYNALTAALTAAKSATRQIAVMKDFFAVGNRSFKANSLKRCVVADMNTRFNVNRVINSNDTASAVANHILTEIKQGRL